MSQQPERAPLTTKALTMRGLILMAVAEIAAMIALLCVTGAI